ncbi:MAG: N-acetylneuraminate synthase family protein [Candidatus Methanomethylicia archaeon]
MKNIIIGNKTISEEGEPFIVAEIGVNFYDIANKYNIELIEAAKLMIKEARDAGADAVKFQTYKAERLASKFSQAYWDLSKETTSSQYELFKKYDKLSEEEWGEISNYASKLGITFLSTPFYKEAVDFLNNLVPAFKISSSDITNIPFIRYVAKKGKPILLSTGASTLSEIDDAVNTILNEGNKNIVIMHCILCYPTAYEHANLNMIKYLKLAFPNFLIGYSDHTLPDENMMTLTLAYLFGAIVIEKHFTLDKTLPGNDHYHAMDPKDLRNLRKNISLIRKVSGDYIKRPIDCEKKSRIYARRSIVAKHFIKEGTIINEDDIDFKRPGTGISPKDIHLVIGRRAKKDINIDELLTWDDLY